MTQTLQTGASGLLAHQRKLDVVANNIANVNTNSYKTQRILFSDLIYSDNRPALGPSDTHGGINPQQIGNGVGVSQVTRNFQQGVLNNTGEDFDFAIQGEGFFVVSGEEQFFTRDGSFATDSNGYLVDPASGSHVQRFGVIGEGNGTDPSYQVAGDNRISVPLGVSVPGRPTSEVILNGNLPSAATPPLAEVLITASPLEVSGIPATIASLLNDLDSNLADYQVGDTIEIVGSNVDGSSFSVSLPVGPASTLGDLVDSINAEIEGASVQVSSTGNLVVNADEAGNALLSLQLSDGTSNVGETDFVNSVFVIETDGKPADSSEATIQVFDQRGQAHNLLLSFEKQDSNVWDARFSSNDSELTLTDDLVARIVFREDGSFQAVDGAGICDSNIELTLNTFSEPQTISINLEGLTHLATNYSATHGQDGFPPGNIVSVNTSSDGILTGVATNGRQIEIAQLAVATFENEHGLESFGSNYFQQTPNSGEPDINTALSAGAGEIRGGQLETSNVDIALEFTQLIVAQRGFSANARSITVATEILQELNSIFN